MKTDKTEVKIRNVLNRIRPYLQSDGGDVEFVKYKDGIVYVRMHGACVGCSYLDSTLSELIESVLLEEVEGVIGVENAEETE